MGLGRGNPLVLLGEVSKMKISSLTSPELNYLRDNCNFVDDEATFFDMRARNASIEQCAEAMNCSVSTANRVSRRVNNKISRVRNW